MEDLKRLASDDVSFGCYISTKCRRKAIISVCGCYRNFFNAQCSASWLPLCFPSSVPTLYFLTWIQSLNLLPVCPTPGAPTQQATIEWAWCPYGGNSLMGVIIYWMSILQLLQQRALRQGTKVTSTLKEEISEPGHDSLDCSTMSSLMWGN